MVKTVDTYTAEALLTARQKGIVPRNFVYIKAKNRTTGAIEAIGFWNGHETITASVYRPSDGTTIDREFVGGGALMSVPSLPAGISLEVRSIRIVFSRLSDAVINAIRAYDPKLAPIEIYRGLLDPDSMRLVAPAICRFDGFINSAPVKVGKAGSQGSVEIEAVPFSRTLTRTNGAKFSDETLKTRSGDRFGRYLDVAGRWRATWGQKESEIGDRRHRPKEKFWR